MKFATSLAFVLPATAVLAAPTVSLRDDAPADPVAIITVNDGLPSNVSPEPAGGPPSWRLDCGAPGTTSLCSASNSGAHCDPITGSLTITLEGTCGACKCISTDQCTGRCG
ncbi:hypothetical protein GGS24DRAFT_503639 [Hypoxylon argillaceum]|nr:hypothetical protein GGS24DRAFT_503639 [Hypoxylon argillaceum]KAI1150839.1 hypothetical protein F4825DRAFT_452081 [Nemania diffusa]